MGGFEELAERKKKNKGKKSSVKTDHSGKIEKINNAINIDEEIEEFKRAAVPMKDDGKFVYVISAEKGAGKTAFAFNEKYFPGNVVVFSFDQKSQRPAKLYGYPERITIFDMNEFLPYDTDNYLYDCVKTYRYMKYLFEKEIPKLKPDWILFDETGLMIEIAEMVMRSRNGLSSFQGTKNPNVWKERKLVLKELHTLALNLSKKGIIYTMYFEKDRIIKESTLITEKDVPKWVGIIMTSTDIVVKITSEKDKKSGKRFYAEITTSKDNDIMEDGSIIDITIPKKKKKSD